MVFFRLLEEMTLEPPPSNHSFELVNNRIHQSPASNPGSPSSQSSTLRK